MLDLKLSEINEMILHPKGKSWSWLGCMLAGEAGEAANILKKMEALDSANWRVGLAHELSDVIVSALIIFEALGINPSVALKEKIEAFRNDPEKVKMYG